jgi:hypothetical protein
VRKVEGLKGGKGDVCCLRVEEGCVGMINININIKAKQFKSMHKILNGKNDNWNSIGKLWLKKYDQIYNIPIYYQNLL